MKNRRLAPELASASEEGAPLGTDDVVQRAEPRWLAIARMTLGFVLVASVSLAVAWGARRYLMTSPRFGLEQVIIDGQKTRTKEGLLARANLKMGQNVFSIDTDAVREKMLGDPYVKTAAVARRLPDTLIVGIEERVPAAVVVIGVDAFLVTRDGETFKRLEVGDPSDLPVITGLSAELAETDRDGFAESVRRALDVVVDYQQSTLASKMSLQEVHVDPSSDPPARREHDLAMTLVVSSQSHGVVSLAIGGPPYRRKLEEAGRVAAELERRGQSPDTILLDGTQRPERVVARVR